MLPACAGTTPEASRDRSSGTFGKKNISFLRRLYLHSRSVSLTENHMTPEKCHPTSPRYARVWCLSILLILLATHLCTAQQANQLYMMEYKVSGRLAMDVKTYSRDFPSPTPTTTAQYYLQSQGVSFSAGASANLIGIKLLIKNTKPNILLVEKIIDASNKENGVLPGINKHFTDLYPQQNTELTQNKSTNNVQAISSEAQGSGVGMHIDSIEVNNQIFKDVTITEVFPDHIRFKHTTGIASLPMTMLSESLQKQLSFDPAKLAAFQAEQQRKLDAAKQRAKDNEDQLKAQKKETTIEPVPVAQSPVKPQAVSHMDTNPEFNGIPLSEIIASAIVATARSPIYELSGGDLPFCDAADRVSSKYSGAKNSSYEAYRERHDALQTLAKDAHPAKILGYVRPGFLLKALNWKSTDSASACFPKSIGGMRYGAVRWSDFSMTGDNSSRKWWNDATQDPLAAIPDTNINTRFKPYPLTAKTLLFDPFEASDAILSNTDNTMTAAWIVQSSDSSVSSKLTRNGGVLAVVETRDGLFLGYLSEKGESGLSQITWEQATSTKNAPFELKAEPAKDLKTGSSVFSLFDAATKTQKRVPSNNPQEFVVFPETYSELLHKGTWALKTSLAVPNDSGFEPLRELETQATFQFEIQKMGWTPFSNQQELKISYGMLV